MTEQSAASGGAAAADPSAVSLIATAYAALRARWPQALGLWAVGIAWTFAARAILWAAHGALRHPSLSLPFFANTLAGATVSAALATLTYRLVLDPGRGWWRPDRGFAACVGLLVLATVAASGLISLSLSPVSVRNVPLLAQHFVLTLGVEVVLYWLYARLLLWPMGALMGNTAMGPARSWALMRGQVMRYLLAAILVNLPLVLLGASYAAVKLLTHRALTQGPDPMTAVVTPILGPAVQLLQHAVAAAVYRARVRNEP
jgi:hypothetical protein